MLAERELTEGWLNEDSIVLHELRLLLYYLIQVLANVCTLECAYKMQCQARIYWRRKRSIMRCIAKG